MGAPRTYQTAGLLRARLSKGGLLAMLDNLRKRSDCLRRQLAPTS
jgi:hypothetical protein